MVSVKRFHSVVSMRHGLVAVLALGIAGALITIGVIAVPDASSSGSQQATVQLGTAGNYAVLASQAITNTGASVVSGDMGIYPNGLTSITGFPPGKVINGTVNAANPAAQQAKADLTTAYNDAASRSPITPVSGGLLGGNTLYPGVYNSASSMALTGTLTLDAQNNPNAVFIFQAGSTLVTAPGSTVSLINGAQACNVFWQVGSSATLNTTTTFVGSIMASASAGLDTGATVQGRVLVQTGSVTLQDNTITVPTCNTAPTTTTTTTTSAPTTSTTTTTGTPTGTGSSSGGPPSGTAPAGPTSPASPPPSGQVAVQAGSAGLASSPQRQPLIPLIVLSGALLVVAAEVWRLTRQRRQA